MRNQKETTADLLRIMRRLYKMAEKAEGQEQYFLADLAERTGIAAERLQKAYTPKN